MTNLELAYAGAILFAGFFLGLWYSRGTIKMLRETADRRGKMLDAQATEYKELLAALAAERAGGLRAHWNKELVPYPFGKWR